MTIKEQRDYLAGMLLLCTDEQREVFRRMYAADDPPGTAPHLMVARVESGRKLHWAIRQVENTLDKH